ncbi:protein of unknown function [Candidatus Methylocalor cossyra]|uniref:Uncharacterized protein n=1 Tax=Candidatus Methylocalor cossyra TaxID=3108543 RepID=A0ABM9NKZ1_9GAMM
MAQGLCGPDRVRVGGDAGSESARAGFAITAGAVGHKRVLNPARVKYRNIMENLDDSPSTDL